MNSRQVLGQYLAGRAERLQELSILQANGPLYAPHPRVLVEHLFLLRCLRAVEKRTVITFKTFKFPRFFNRYEKYIE